MSLDAMILDIHLYVIVQSEIGLKSFIQVGETVFGTKAIKVELIPGSIALVAKKYRTASQKLGLVMR